MDTSGLMNWARERERIRRKRAAGKPGPWTEDHILAKYRFCNVRRNDDRQTRLIHQNWLTHYSEHEDVWFAMTVARFVNWWPTLARMGTPLPWAPRDFNAAVKEEKERGGKAFSSAYMIRAVEGLPKAQYLAEQVLTPMWLRRKDLRPRKGDTLDAFHKRLLGCYGLGGFLAGQIVADTKYADGWLNRAPDFHTWACSGPGSRRGLARVAGYEPSFPWKEAAWRKVFAELWMTVRKELSSTAPGVTAQDLQNCLCEFDKYERARLGEGSPKQLFTPEGE